MILSLVLKISRTFCKFNNFLLDVNILLLSTLRSISLEIPFLLQLVRISIIIKQMIRLWGGINEIRKHRN